MIYPLKTIKIITAYGGSTPFQKIHNAVDLQANYDYLYAPQDGIIRTYYGKTGGNWLELASLASVKHRFAHLDRYFVKDRQKVKEGQKIAITGNTGTQTTAPHLHWEVWLNNKLINPIEFIKKMTKTISNGEMQQLIFAFLGQKISEEDAKWFIEKYQINTSKNGLYDIITILIKGNKDFPEWKKMHEDWFEQLNELKK